MIPRALGFSLALAAAGTVTAAAAWTVLHPSDVDVSGAPAAQQFKDMNPGYDGRFQFVRIQYTPASRGGFGFGRRGGREPMWAHDYPRAERHFMQIIEETTFVDAVVNESNILTLDDPDLFKYPVAYMVEVGSWEPTDEEARGLGEYLLKGGFLIVDDFRDPWNLSNFQLHLSRAVPDAVLVELDLTHPIFDSFFRIDPYDVLPPYGGQPAVYLGVFEDNDPAKRLMAVINYNNDIAEYWEFSDRGYYSIDLSNEAYKLGVNYVVYALTH